jgi:hypothetical protein
MGRSSAFDTTFMFSFFAENCLHIAVKMDKISESHHGNLFATLV